MSLSRIISLAAAIGAIAIVPAAALAAGASAPKLVKAELVTAPEINHGTSAVVFRTDHTLARGQNGGTLKGRAGVGSASSSVGTVRGAGGHPCYVGYITRSLKVGHQYKVVIAIGDTEYHRTLSLQHPKKVADRGADLGC